jgi:hypothetical protein
MMTQVRWVASAVALVAMAGATAVGSTLIGESPERSAVPDSLDNATFWRLTQELSEPGGYFRSDNFVSNEGELQYVIPELTRAIGPGRPYVGVGPEQNFTYIAALRPNVAFIVDIRRQNLVLQLMYKGLMELSPDRATFVSRLLARRVPDSLSAETGATELFSRYATAVPDTMLFWTTLDTLRKHLMDTRGFPLDAQDKESLFYVYASFAEGGADLSYSFGAMGGQRYGRWMPTLAEMMTETDGEGAQRSYLATEANYQYVREMQRRNMIIPVVGDYGVADGGLHRVAAWLAAHEATLGAFYASNVEQYLYMTDGSPARFFATLSEFPMDSSTRFVRSVANRGWLPLRNMRSRLAQRAVPLEAMLELARAGKAGTYWELVTGLEP